MSLQRVREQTPVFNLQTDHPNTFFAGVVVHNKGGGGGGGAVPAPAVRVRADPVPADPVPEGVVMASLSSSS
ncbi:MAG: hypothetical protein M0C28_32890 [Candidatus Moduliflexus flocculans]|nr:hypothetical protein [Candidatus Moduliflexus flocculans]